MIIDHIGIAVKSIEKGMNLWESLFGYRQKTEIVINTRQKVRVVFLRKDKSIDIKLIEPTDSSSSIYAFAQRGGGLHHLCFKCAVLHTELGNLQQLGVRILALPEPGEAFQNEEIAFIFAGQGLNIELIDTEKRANQLKEPKGSVT
jgi:methylmalonyl-CoA/ethylmalonyl-CoA epimerase